MKKPIECRDQTQRRRDIRAHTDPYTGRPDLNGLDYLEVDDTQTVLTVYFLGKAPSEEDLTINNIRIEGGVRVRNIKVIGRSLCHPRDPRVDDCMQVTLDKAGDFSTYTLRLVRTDARGKPTNEPLEGFDPYYAQLSFSFKVNCPSDLDCAPAQTCPPPQLAQPEINYLAKDYASFRQLILDRLAFLMPDWQERHVPDLGITLVELLAYVGDYLSYYQDAVATEAYLQTARQRISVRRHAKLIDYQMHEGCNARAWLFIHTDTDEPPIDPSEIFFITGTKELFSKETRLLTVDDLEDIAPGRYEVFEPLIQRPGTTLKLYQWHNQISFYTWGDRECCLQRGATRATLKDEWEQEEEEPTQQYYATATHENQTDSTTQLAAHKPIDRRGKPEDYELYHAIEGQAYEAEMTPPPPPPPAGRRRKLHLTAGDLLIFEEVIGPRTHAQPDADPTHRHVVRLTKVETGVDPLSESPAGQPFVEIEWAEEDALPFTLCLSSIGPAPFCLHKEVSVARGNLILVDHGRRVAPQESWLVTRAIEPVAECIAVGEPLEPESQEVTERADLIFTPLAVDEPQASSGANEIFQKPSRPTLKYSPLTSRAPFPEPAVIARAQSRLLSQLVGRVKARIDQLWRRVRDGHLLSSEEVGELRTIFGAAALAQAGFEGTARRFRQPLSLEAQARAFENLLALEDKLLAKKLRRVVSLIALTRDGYLIGKQEEEELAELFGQRFALNMGTTNEQLLGPASYALRQNPRDALPDITLLEERASAVDEAHASADAAQAESWMPQSDLLDSEGRDRHFVVEVDNDGKGHLRFGNGVNGSAPAANTVLTARYRYGNGSSGNVGAETISFMVTRNRLSGIGLSVRNPLPAQGGTDPEAVDEVKFFAPVTFREEIERAIIADDYARLSERGFQTKVQRAAASPMRWTGSWYEARVAIDQFNTEEMDAALLDEITDYLERYRRMGHDLTVNPARFVSLSLGLRVCVAPHYLRGHVEAALIDLFSNRTLPGGQLGFFHPDNLTFGQGIYVSQITAAAQAVEGVESVEVTKLERLFEGPNNELKKGLLPLTSLEVARLDNDPSFPEHGVLRLDIRGGR